MAKLSKAVLQRQQKVDYVATLGEDESLDLDKIIAEHGPGLTIHWESGYYDDPGSVTIRRIREESDDEYEARLELFRQMERDARNTVKAAAERKLMEERATYERLRKKFEES